MAVYLFEGWLSHEGFYTEKMILLNNVDLLYALQHWNSLALIFANAAITRHYVLAYKVNLPFPLTEEGNVICTLSLNLPLHDTPRASFEAVAVGFSVAIFPH